MSKQPRPNSKKQARSRRNESDGEGKSTGVSAAHSIRETIESVAIAFILAFLFRAFEAEAFVIPTGSMAPTLQGTHKDIICPQCGHRYRAGASQENEDSYGVVQGNKVEQCVCPICQFTARKVDEMATYSGDRIIVNKFAYELGEPERWDVFVFRYEGDAKMNYIKRLVGLPNETIKLLHGDLFVKPDGEEDFTIERKPPRKVKAMLHLVDDNHHIAKKLNDAGWPLRWQPADGYEASWPTKLEAVDLENGQQRQTQSFKFSGEKSDQFAYLEYHHYRPTAENWRTVLDLPAGQQREFDREEKLILDYYAYNDLSLLPPGRELEEKNWVGDLAVESEINIEDAAGHLELQLVEGGFVFSCDIDLKSGKALLSVDHPTRRNANGGKKISIPFKDGENPVLSTGINKPGKYKLLFANVDDQLLLWVDDDLVPTDSGSTRYVPLENHEKDGQDYLPVRIGAKNTRIIVDRIKVKRDVYYISDRYHDPHKLTGFNDGVRRQELRNLKIQDKKEGVTFEIGEDSFFAMGDNSPRSKDSRLWVGDEIPHVVQRRMLIGKAIFIYWPHALEIPGIGWPRIVPNFSDMRFIR